MVHKSGFCWLFLLAVLSCRQDIKTRVVVCFDEAAIGSEVCLTIKDSVYRTVLDSTRTAIFDLAADIRADYAELYHERNWISVYIEPGKSLEVRKDREGKLYFAGESGEINTYLNSDVVNDFQLDYHLDEKAFIRDWNRQLDRLFDHLDAMAFDQSFMQVEKRRLYYVCCNRLALYPYLHARSVGQKGYRPSGEYYAFAEKMIQEDEKAWELSAYKSAFRNIIYVYGDRGMQDQDPLQLLKNQSDYIENHISSPRLAAYLIDLLFTEYVEQNGIDNLDSLLFVYDTKVTDPVKIARFKELYARWAKLKKGELAPGFVFCDILGDTINLTDFRGKYVYIDVWATWCYFCCREIPDLQKLEQQMKKYNIFFVSISVDKDEVAWKKKVREDSLGGIQLNTLGDRSFQNAYRIKGIPRFILVDKEGKIVRVNMTRPSDPKTLQTLLALPGIE